MTNTTNNAASLSYAQRVAQIICNGLYPEADGKSLAEFPESTRANLLDIAEAVLRGTPTAPARGGVDPSSDEARALYETDMRQWFTDNPGGDPAPVDTWRLGFNRSRQSPGEMRNYRKELAEAMGHPDVISMGRPIGLAWELLLAYVKDWRSSIEELERMAAQDDDGLDSARLEWLMKVVNCDEIDALEPLPFGGTLQNHLSNFRNAIDTAMKGDADRAGNHSARCERETKNG